MTREEGNATVATPTTSNGTEVFRKASSLFNEAVKLYNKSDGTANNNEQQIQQFTEAANMLSTSASHFMQYIQFLSKTPVTDKNKTSLVNNLQKAKSAMTKAHELRSRCLFKADQFKAAMQSFVQTIFFLDFHLMNEDKALNTQIIDLVDRYVRCKYKMKQSNGSVTTTNLQPFTLHNLLQKQKTVANETNKHKFAVTTHWKYLLEEELKCYESYDSVVFRQERDISIDQLLSYKEERDLEYVVLLFRKNTMLMNEGLIRQALDNAVRCYAILKTCSHVEKYSYYMSIVLLRAGTCAIQTKVSLSNVDLHQNIEIEKLYDISSITEGFNLITLSIDNYYVEALKWINEVDPNHYDRALYNECKITASILEYYGSGLCVTLFHNATPVIEKSSIPIHDKISWYVQAVRFFIDVGDMTIARQLIRKGYSLLEESREDQKLEMSKIAFLIIESYFFITYDSLSRGLKAIAHIRNDLTERRLYLDLLSDCKYYYALSYLRGRNIPENIDSFSAIESALSALSCRTSLLSVGPNFERVNNLCLSLLQTGQIYESRGYTREATHYLHQGLLLSGQHFNISLCAQFLTSLGNIERKKCCSAKTISLLVDAMKLWHKLDSTYRIQRIIALIELSEAYRDSQQFNESSDCLSQATSLLEQMISHMNGRGSMILSPSKGSRRSIGGSNSLLNSDHYTISMLTSMIDCHYGVVKKSLGQYAEATSMFSKALRYIQDVNSQDAAIVRYHLGVEYLAQLEEETINEFAHQMAYDQLSTATSMISFETPTITKPVLSAMSLCAVIQDPIWSSYLLNSGMSISLSHIKNDIIQYRKKIAQSLENPNLDKMPMTTKLQQESRKSLIDSLSHLPKGFSVCTVSLSHDYKHLILSRLEHGMEPLTFSVTNSKTSQILENETVDSQTDQSNDPLYYLHLKCPNSLLYTIHHAFDDIIKSDGKLGLNVDNIKTKEETILYWKQREQLDDKMRKLLLSMENELLGFKKILLSGNLMLSEQKDAFLLNVCSKIQTEIQSCANKCVNVNVIRLILSHVDCLSLGELKQWLHYLSDIVDDEQIDNLCQLFYESFLSIFNESCNVSESSVLPNDPEEVVTPVVSRVAQLAKRRRRQRLDSSTTIVENCIANSPQEDSLCLSSPLAKKPKHHVLFNLGQKVQTQVRKNNLQRHHTVLILDKIIQRLPIESIPCLRNQSITRMPSLYLLNCHLSHFKNEIQILSGDQLHYSVPVSISKCFYILNPSGDLQKTQARFQPQFERNNDWCGIIDRAPIHEEFVHALSNYPLLIYMGHGAGNQYYNSDVLRRQVSNCSVSLLLGCSSGALAENGHYEPSGTVHSFLFANSPCVVSALWDVTSNECDRMAQHMIDGMCDELAQHKEGTQLTKLVASARDQCKLRYLMGSAMVCYGLPVRIHMH